MIIIKIGGGGKINIEGICEDIKNLEEKIIIVHGANHSRDELGKKLGKEKKILTSLSGYDSVFSDEEAIDTIMMSYSGIVNKKIVECLQKKCVNAIGLSGIDGRVIQGERNKGIRVKERDKVKIVRDFSGKPKKVNKNLLSFLLEQNYVPVLTIPIIDEEGFAINSENDDIVSLLQETFQADKIIQLIEAPGLLQDSGNEGSLIKEIKKETLEELEQKVQGRMKRKILALKKLFQNSHQEKKVQVMVSDGRIENPVKDALNGGGTIIK